jgi:hypothetical protein
LDANQNAPTIVLVQELGLHHATEQDLGVCETVVTVALHSFDECALLLNPVIAIRNVPIEVGKQL